MIAVYKRELRSYFNSMIGYIFIAVVLVFIGLYFTAVNLSSGYPYFSYTLAQTMTVFLFMTPILTMKSMAEERRSKTDQLLLTAPISVTKVVLGKYLAMLTIFAIPLLISCYCPLILATSGDAHLGVDFSTMLAFLLLGGLFVSIGMFISALTESQIIAAVGSFASLLAVYMWEDLTGFLPTTMKYNMIGLLIITAIVCLLLYHVSHNTILVGGVAVVAVAAILISYFTHDAWFASLLPNLFGSLSILAVLENFAFNYVFDVGGLFLYVSLAALFVFLTIQTVQKRRWN